MVQVKQAVPQKGKKVPEPEEDEDEEEEVKTAPKLAAKRKGSADKQKIAQKVE